MRSSIQVWLATLILSILGVVIIGGITRLTGSGLSITEWKPIMGAIPPLNESDWLVAFEKYQQIPQFKFINSSMTLEGFKWIFFWEYLHRLLARTVGLIFLFPFLYFYARKKIERKWTPYLLGAFLLGGAQGALGWFMVSSGLSVLTYVSHFRLAAHLTLALAIAAYLLWIFYKVSPTHTPRPFVARRPWIALIALTWLQTLWGAFTAGLKSGYQFPTFPTFHGYWMHPQLWALSPHWINIFSNPITVQWIHRILATLIVILLTIIFSKALKAGQARLLLPSFALVLLQYSAGIALVLAGMPVWLGALHQGVGSLFLLSVMRVYYVSHTRAA